MDGADIKVKKRGGKMNLKNVLSGRIEAVNEALASALDVCGQDKLRRAISHIPMAGGKRLRPVLAMVAADAISQKGKKAIPFGVSLELIHNFTLLHDDVMDKDELRRGVQTVHTLFDEATAINAGDVLFARAFEVLSTTEVPDAVLRVLVREVAEAVRDIGEGQQLDKDFEQRTDISEDDYLRMIEFKTARLFQIACKGGAMIGGGSKKQIDAMSRYGRTLGMGFQVWDDYLDLTADEAKLGKPVGSDIKNGKRTLMVVHGLKRLKDDEKETFLGVLGNQKASRKDIGGAIALLDSVGSLSHAKQVALDYAGRSKQLLGVLPDSKPRQILDAIADYMVSREK